jgi:protein-S-isoprenylcysteine O-methyltransferase Ste14
MNDKPRPPGGNNADPALKPKRQLDTNAAYKLRGAFGFFFLLPATAIAMLSEPVIREGTWANVACDAVAWLVFLAGVTFRIWSTLYVGARKFKTLVDQGPYSICRNPLYVGTFLMAIGSALFLKSMVVAAAVAFLMIAYTLGTVPAEERALLRQHGESYAAYLARVPRYFPKFSLFSSPSLIEVKLNGIRLEAKRLLVWIWLPLLGEFLGHLRVQPWWPHLFRLF